MQTINPNKITHFACGIDNQKISIKNRISNIFDDSKKRKGILVLVAVILIAIAGGSVFVIGNNKVKQTNDSLTIYTFGKQYQQAEFLQSIKHAIMFNDNMIYKSLDPYDVDAAIAYYKNSNPNVKVNLVEFDDGTHDSAYIYDKLYVEIMAGRGPDVIIGDSSMCIQKDIYKMMEAGVFAPLNDFVKNDPNFNKYSYLMPVMNNGFYRGERYVLPLRFSIGVMLSGENALKKAGINADACKRDYLGYMQEVNRYLLSNHEASQKLFTKEINISDQFLYMDFVGMNGSKNKSTKELQQLIELYKPIAKLEYGTPDMTNNYSVMIRDEGYTFLPTSQDSTTVFLSDGIQSLQLFDTPVLVPIRRPDGGINAVIDVFAAINSSSNNQQNAYDFIKLLLGPESEFYYNKGISPNREIIDVYMHSISPNDIYNYNLVETDKVPRQYFDEYVSYIYDVDNAYFLSPLDKSIMQEMMPYINNEESYESCIRTIQNKVNIYLAE